MTTTTTSIFLVRFVVDCRVDFDLLMLRRASDKCQREKRKTINGDDLLWAMATLGFEDYIDPLKMYLQKFREVCLIYLSLPGKVVVLDAWKD